MKRFSLAVSLALAVACNAESPPRGPEETCFRVCAARATRCSRHECARGCNLVLDRLVENEGDHVLACVTRTKAPCDDRAWSHCAALVSVHADGGPAPPPPRTDDFED